MPGGDAPARQRRRLRGRERSRRRRRDTAAAGGGGAFQGDDSQMPSWGGWAWGNVPAEAVARAGFDWFETGYPGDTRTNEILAGGGVRPFAYINLGELHDDLRDASGYSGPILRTNGDWGTYLVDVTRPLLAGLARPPCRRGVPHRFAWREVGRGDARRAARARRAADVNDAIASVMQRILPQHPDLKFVFNQGFDFALAYPQFVHGVQTEGLFSASSYPGGVPQAVGGSVVLGPAVRAGEGAPAARDPDLHRGVHRPVRPAGAASSTTRSRRRGSCRTSRATTGTSAAGATTSTRGGERWRTTTGTPCSHRRRSRQRRARARAALDAIRRRVRRGLAAAAAAAPAGGCRRRCAPRAAAAPRRGAAARTRVGT